MQCFHRRRVRKRRSGEENPAPQTTDVDTTYEEINLPKISAAKSSELTGFADNEDEANYENLKTVRDKGNHYY